MEKITVPFPLPDGEGCHKDKLNRPLNLDAIITFTWGDIDALHGKIYINPISGSELHATFKVNAADLTVTLHNIHSRLEGCRQGTLMLNSLLNAIDYLERDKGCVCKEITGWLSSSDKVDKRWGKSLSFYQNFSNHNSSCYMVSCLFQSWDKKSTYSDCVAFMRENNEGRVIFTLKR